MGSEENEMNIQQLKKELVCGIIVLFLSANIVPTFSQHRSPCAYPCASENIDHFQTKSGILIYHGSVSGHVTDVGMNPVKDVRVRVSFHDTYRESDTNATGYYKVTDIPVCADAKNVSCTRLGYYPTYASLNINQSIIHDFILTSMPIYPMLYESLGENGWYTNEVVISFHINGTVNHTYYALDEGPWTEYTAPISITQDGMHVLHWHDTYGNSSGVYWVGFKIDRTAPVIIDFRVSPLNVRKDYWLMNASVVDGMSGVTKVEYYVDDIFVGNMTRAPYELLFHGRGDVAQIIVYDEAGNSCFGPMPSFFIGHQTRFRQDLVGGNVGMRQSDNPVLESGTRQPEEGRTTMHHGSLSGHVTDAGMNPLQGARVCVSFHDTYRENITDATGYYKVTDIPVCPCVKNVTCTKVGYFSTYSSLCVNESTTHDFILDSMPAYPVFSGTMGENGWYVSPVGFVFAGNETNHTHYAFNEEPWKEYTEPLMMSKDGIHVLHWLWSDEQGTSLVYWVDFKIDCTGPTVVFTVQRLGVKLWKFSANVNDKTSGINRVEIIADHQILRSFTGPPYEVAWIGFGFVLLWKFLRTGDWGYLPHCEPYDNAGNTAIAPMKK